MASGGSCPVQLIPPDHVGAAAREKSHSCTVFEAPLDHLIDTQARSCSEISGLVLCSGAASDTSDMTMDLVNCGIYSSSVVLAS